MPRVVIKTGFVAPDGGQVELAEYICDRPGCPNIATQVLGCIKELGLSTAVCDEHAPQRPDIRPSETPRPGAW